MLVGMCVYARMSMSVSHVVISIVVSLLQFKLSLKALNFRHKATFAHKYMPVCICTAANTTLSNVQ